MTRSLITGGFGFLGRCLALQLLKEGHEVTLFDIVSDDSFLQRAGGGLKSVRGTLSDWSQVMGVVHDVRPDSLFHSGAALPPASEISPQTAFQANVVGTFNVLEAARLCETGMVVYASTMTSFGPDTPPLVPNDFAQHPLSMYGTTKVCCERLGEYYYRHYNLDFRTVRLPAVFGVGRAAAAGWTAYTSVAIEEAARGRPYVIRASEETTTDILYVEDAARAMIDLASAEPSRLTARCYNLHGHLVTARELVDAIKKVIPEAVLSFAPDAAIVDGIKTMPRQLDDSLARKDWGWQPGHDLHEAIADFVAAVRGR
ncbi:MAG: NAD-dependent epimerase/dehydratase family protein [Dehalococcoidia bacterium]|nr:NAD-dependent epimerase/dehydratase family protein [Dehalococcoidia bacterium]